MTGHRATPDFEAFCFDQVVFISMLKIASLGSHPLCGSLLLSSFSLKSFQF